MTLCSDHRSRFGTTDSVDISTWSHTAFDPANAAKLHQQKPHDYQEFDLDYITRNASGKSVK